MLKDVVIRQLRNEDAPSIHSVALESWHHTYRNIFNQEFIQNFVDNNYSPQTIASLFPRIQSGEMSFHVAEHKSKIIGFSNIGIAENNAELYRIYLLPTFIGQGIGKKLLEHGEAFVIEHSINSYFCFVNKNNKIGKRFYLNSGFKHIPEKDTDDELYMEKRLES